MLLNVANWRGYSFTAFIVSELLKENQAGGGWGKLSYPLPQIKVESNNS